LIANIFETAERHVAPLCATKLTKISCLAPNGVELCQRVLCKLVQAFYMWNQMQ